MRLSEPQTVSISSSVAATELGVDLSTGGQLSLSSSSQGSLAALKPTRSVSLLMQCCMRNMVFCKFGIFQFVSAITEYLS